MRYVSVAVAGAVTTAITKAATDTLDTEVVVLVLLTVFVEVARPVAAIARQSRAIHYCISL